MDLATVRTALTLLENGESFSWATIIDSLGSSPRHDGAHMLVRADGSIVGTIGGGALEAAAIKNALEVLDARESRLMDYNLTNSDSAKLGMICGGNGLMLIDYVDSSNVAVGDLFCSLLDLLNSGRKGWLVIAIPQGDQKGWTAGKCLVDSDGSVAGDPVCPTESLEELAKKGGTYDQIIAGGTARTYVQPIGTQGIVHVFGAGHCGQKLVSLLSAVGFFTVVVDDRADFANRERFPTADSILVPDSFEDVMGTLSVDEESYVVIMTRGHLHDRTVLKQALNTRAGYVGMIGSRKKVAETLQALQEEGFSPDDAARVHAPIGLSIGAESPEEIAVSIAAQLIEVRAGRHR
jgi:xanthine dehydrogenase accessory factor